MDWKKSEKNVKMIGMLGMYAENVCYCGLVCCGNEVWSIKARILWNVKER